MRSDPNGYILNDIKVSLYRLMEEFNRYTPKGLIRFKGLGEMDAPELGISALHPEFNRTLIRYTTNDIIKEIEEIRRIDSDKSEYRPSLNLLLSISFLVIYYISEKLLYFQKEEVL